nr:MAG TPA: hypothetical protein [Caudoviricetes sp.]
MKIKKYIGGMIFYVKNVKNYYQYIYIYIYNNNLTYK